MSTFILSILTGAKARIKNFETVYTCHLFLKIMEKLGQNLKYKNESIQISCDGGAATENLLVQK